MSNNNEEIDYRKLREEEEQERHEMYESKHYGAVTHKLQASNYLQL